MRGITVAKTWIGNAGISLDIVGETADRYKIQAVQETGVDPRRGCLLRKGCYGSIPKDAVRVVEGE